MNRGPAHWHDTDDQRARRLLATGRAPMSPAVQSTLAVFVPYLDRLTVQDLHSLSTQLRAIIKHREKMDAT